MGKTKGRTAGGSHALLGKIAAVFTAVMLLVTMTAGSAFAANSARVTALADGITTAVGNVSTLTDLLENAKTGPNAQAFVIFDNPYCVKLPEVKDLSVRVYKAGTDIDVSIPVTKLEQGGDTLSIWTGQVPQRVSDHIMKEMAGLQAKVDLGKYNEHPEKLVTDIDDIMNNFSVELVGLPADHFTYQGGAFVITNEIFKQAVQILKDAYIEQNGSFTSFSDIIQSTLKEMGVTVDDLTQDMSAEDAAKFKGTIENIDSLIDYMSSDAFTGVMVAGAQVGCSDPYYAKYQVQQRYYKYVNGKLKYVGSKYAGKYDKDFGGYCFLGKVGDRIKASDYIDETYKGKTYSYLGSYDSDVVYDGSNWSNYKLTSFKVGSNTSGLVLRYVTGTPGTSAANGTSSNGGNGTAVSTGQNSAENSGSYAGSAPNTGDDSPLGLYVGILVAALVVTGGIAAYRKKK